MDQLDGVVSLNGRFPLLSKRLSVIVVLLIPRGEGEHGEKLLYVVIADRATWMA
jgi:hypothetical protein